MSYIAYRRNQVGVFRRRQNRFVSKIVKSVLVLARHIFRYEVTGHIRRCKDLLISYSLFMLINQKSYEKL